MLLLGKNFQKKNFIFRYLAHRDYLPPSLTGTPDPRSAHLEPCRPDATGTLPQSAVAEEPAPSVTGSSEQTMKRLNGSAATNQGGAP